jgi:hypothetical protein
MRLRHWVLLAGVAGFAWTVKYGSAQQGPPDANARQVMTTYYASGKLRTEVTYAAGRKEGPSRQFRSDGTLEAEGGFRDSRMEGRWTFWREDGSIDLSRSGVYVGGELERPEAVAAQPLDDLPSASSRE